MITIMQPVRFEWDQGNRDKNWIKHQVSEKECEEIFFDKDNKFREDAIHSTKEKRFLVIGKTKSDRVLFIVFTMRDHKIRIISARDLNKRKEGQLYEKNA